MPSEPPGERSYRWRYRRWNSGSPQQAIKLAETSPRCKDCGHTQWFHMGLREPGCVWLGSCDCPAFVDARKETA